MAEDESGDGRVVGESGNSEEKRRLPGLGICRRGERVCNNTAALLKASAQRADAPACCRRHHGRSAAGHRRDLRQLNMANARIKNGYSRLRRHCSIAGAEGK